MKKLKREEHFLKYAWVLFILASLMSCKKTTYELTDPSTAGVWTLMNSNLPSNSIRDIKRDTRGNLWVAFQGGGVGVISKVGEWTYYNSGNSALISNSVTSLGPTLDGGMIIGTLNGISIRSADGQWSSYKDPDVTSMVINCIKETSDGRRWLGTEGDGYYLDSGSGFSQVYYGDDYANVHAIEGDNIGNVFLGTDNGLIAVTGTNAYLFTTSNGLPDNFVQALCFDSRNRLWIGTSGGATVCWANTSTGSVTQLSLLNSDAGSFVRSIYEDRRGYIWFATWFDGLVEYNNVVPITYKKYNGFYEDDVNCIGDDSDSNLWIGLYSNGLVKYTLPIDNTAEK